jgi:hypothetical protein
MLFINTKASLAFVCSMAIAFVFVLGAVNFLPRRVNYKHP